MSEELGPCPVCGGGGVAEESMVWCEGDCSFLTTREYWQRLSRAARLARAVEVPEGWVEATSTREVALWYELGYIAARAETDAPGVSPWDGPVATAPTLADALVRLADEVTP